ncbi:MAG: N-acetylmuramoyl-L-alanine amidase, partial [Chloroflexota bacterium]
ARTEWNKQHVNPKDKLHNHEEWGIVLHWFGDKDHHGLRLPGYLAGFDSDKIVGEQVTQTSSHFLVGDDEVDREDSHDGYSVGIVQTQVPTVDGMPYVSSHLLEAPYKVAGVEENYFMKATNELVFGKPMLKPILPNLYKRPSIDPNLVTMSIEIAGSDFDNEDHYASMTKIANVVSLVAALMKRYQISGINILGHHEFDLEKADPGKNFLGLIRMLIGLLALKRNDEELIELVFGQFIDTKKQLSDGIKDYFQFIRDYLLLVSDPAKVFVFEKYSKYLLVREALNNGGNNEISIAGSFIFPVHGAGRISEVNNLAQNNHAGLDVGLEDETAGGVANLVKHIQLIGDGNCIHLGESNDGHWGKTIMFRHRLADASEIISIYANLIDIEELAVGGFYSKGSEIGSAAVRDGLFPGFLHFSIAYGGTWETDLDNRPFVPATVSPTWIRQRFMDPVEFYENMYGRYVREVDWGRLEQFLQ